MNYILNYLPKIYVIINFNLNIALYESAVTLRSILTSDWLRIRFSGTFVSNADCY